MGPTASGKTAIAAQYCQRYGAEVISVDSALVYRGLNIGSAKPDAALLQQAPHHLINLRSPHQAYSAADFAQDALLALNDLQQRGKLPLLVGGTGLYFRALFQGLSTMPEADLSIRVEIEQEAKASGWSALHRELLRIDPAAAARINPADTQRISRALEVWRISGRSMSDWQGMSPGHQPFPFRVLKLVISPDDRALLHQRIAQRFEQMLAAGFLDEARALASDPTIGPDLPAMRAVGYRQALAHLRGETDFEQFRAQAIAATRQLAKRQLTWLRSEYDARWFDPERQRAELDLAVDLFFTRR